MGNYSSLPATFDGWRFKSRTEARWAVFFKQMAIPYDYEPDGLDLDGVYYRPDFFLPSIKMWAEVKPLYVNGDEERKIRLLVEATHIGCLLLTGTPDFQAYRAITWDSGDTTFTDYSLDVDMYWRLHHEEHRLFSQPSYNSPAKPEEFSAPYQAAVYSARGWKFDEDR